MITIIDYRLGNIRSVEKAFEKINQKTKTTSKPEDLEKATHIVLPGVGSFKDGMKNLQDLGLIEPLKKQILVNKKPFLGICLGMQLLAEKGEEHGNFNGLGLIRGIVKRLNVKRGVKLPHMGWNDIVHNNSRLFENIPQNTNFYFIHSYHFLPDKEENISSTCIHGGKFVSSIENNNIYGVQFHPEKSQKFGLQLLKNFAEKC